MSVGSSGNPWNASKPWSGVTPSQNVTRHQTVEVGTQRIYVACGHGFHLAKHFPNEITVPKGCKLVFWVKHSVGLDDSLGNRVDSRRLLNDLADETGTSTNGLPEIKQYPDKVFNYVLTAPTKLDIGGSGESPNFITVKDGEMITLLEIFSILGARNNGNSVPIVLHWSACRTVWRYENLTQMTQIGVNVGTKLQPFMERVCKACKTAGYLRLSCQHQAASNVGQSG